MNKYVFPAVIAVLLAALLWQRYESQDEEIMPSALPADEQRELYLTSRGKYRDSDIEANGRQTPAERLRGFRPQHDFNPRRGDRLCPVTRTKAHPDCVWIIDGQEYWFCCPPCIDEFVQRAREAPEEIQPAESYVRQ